MRAAMKEIYKSSRFNSLEILKLIFDSYSENEYVRAEVVDNVNTPDFILEKLSKDKNRVIRYYANKNLGIKLNKI